jgi:hypothetical protein
MAYRTPIADKSLGMAEFAPSRYLPSMPDAAFSLNFGRPPANRELEELELAYRSLPASQREQAVKELRQAAARGERSLEGLFAAWRDDVLAGAVFTERHPGESATLWPPGVTERASPSLADELLARALSWLEAKGVEMVQCVLTTDCGEDARRLQQAGFDHPCDLICLVSEADQFPTAPVGAGLTFERVTPQDMDDLAGIVEQTYENTLDCPALDASRDCRKVLAGYQATCRDDLSNWFLIRGGQHHIGCLLLGRDAAGKTWELMYMGLVSAARGRGRGLEIVRQAQWLVAQQAGARLLLAVDAANEPALRVYAAAGFSIWDRRSVFLKMLSPRPR